jgi:hypothetical protein
MNELYGKFNLKYPYLRFLNDASIKENVIGWNGISPSILQEIVSINPNLIIEVGSFLGHSTCILGDAIKKNNPDFTLLCIDTWLGSIEHWRGDLDLKLHLWNGFENGISGLYDQFLKNIIIRGLHNNVIPIPCTSYIGHELLKHNNIQSDVIYIDGSHEEMDVYYDLKRYYSLLKSGGIIFGDDIDFQSVQLGVGRFCNVFNRSYKIYDNRFWKIV